MDAMCERYNLARLAWHLGSKEYAIPPWCRMSPGEHFDGMGGCWGINRGYVRREREDYCGGCDMSAHYDKEKWERSIKEDVQQAEQEYGEGRCKPLEEAWGGVW